MSISNSIRLTLNIKDENLNFSDNCVSEVMIDGVLSLVYEANLSPSTPNYCPKCGCMNSDFDIIKNGSKYVMIKLPRVSNRKTILKIKKQRYFCKHCSQTFIADTSCVERNHSISYNVYHSALLDLKTKQSVKDISKRLDISHGTLNSWLHELSDNFIVNLNTLPENLCFDEFKSVGSKMSFICMDAATGEVLDILQDRTLSFLKSYFFRFPKEARDKVKTVCIDMYEPYISLIHACFPNANIITDRFHIIQLVNRSFNSTRINIMNDNKKHYAPLKRYWKLLLKNHHDLDNQKYLHFTGFKYKMTQSQVVDELLRVSPELSESYWLCQNIRRAIRKRDPLLLNEILAHEYKDISKLMQKSLKTIEKHRVYIQNALINTYSNGILEGTNNLIKVIKRIAFGYTDFHNFRARILLITNTMVKFETKKPLPH